MERIGRQDKRIGSDQRGCDQSYIKQINIQTVLAVLKRYQPISRTDIAKMTGMSPTSITRIVTALLSQGLIYEASGEQRVGRGRKATSLCVNENGLYSIGIHLECSMIRMCVMNFANEVLYRVETLVDGECTPERMAKEAKALFDRMPEGIVSDRSLIGAVGVCVSGTVDVWHGGRTTSSWMGWKNVELEEIFGKEFGMMACIENDVKACLIGEKVRMGISDETDTVYLLADKGIGMAATSGGLLVRGVNNEAGEIENIPFGRKSDGRQLYLFDYLRQDKLIERAREYDRAVNTLDALLWVKQQGHDWAEGMIRGFREYLENTVRMILCINNPAKLVIGGSVVQKLYPDIAEKMDSEIVCVGTHYEQACMMGAGLIALRHAVVERIGQNIE